MSFCIDMIDVGEGDAFLLSAEFENRDFTMLIDAGGATTAPRVVDFLHEHAGGRLDVIIGTHLDNDHIGGIKAVAEECDLSTAQLYLNLPDDPTRALRTLTQQRLFEHEKQGADWACIQRSLQTSTELVEALKTIGLTPQPLIAGDYWELGDLIINVLNPTRDRLVALWEEIEEPELRSFIKRAARGQELAPSTSAENNSSIVLELVYKGTPFGLFAADTGADVLREITAGTSYHFLKVPHHGSKTGLDNDLIQQLNPRVAFLPVGPNAYGHPASEILDMLKEVGCKTYCSQKTPHCRKECPLGGFGNMSLPCGRPLRDGWTVADHSRCRNNVRAVAAAAGHGFLSVLR